MTTTTRTDIFTAKAAAVLAPQRSDALAAEVTAIPTVLAGSKTLQFPIICKYTGFVIGQLSLGTTAGHLPLLGQWRDTMALHPLFSLETGALLHFSRNTWFKFCNFTQEESDNDAVTDKQERALCIAALVMLHRLANVHQDITWVPKWKDVSAHWSSLIALSYWKLYLESTRFRFPELRLSKREPEIELGSYLQACWAVKRSYETTVIERIDQEKLDIADKALLAIRLDMATGNNSAPKSTKLLWRWFVANMPSRYEADLEGWMRSIYFAKDDDILKFTVADIDLFEEIVACECPVGNSISYAFNQVLAARREYVSSYFQGFEIIIPDAIKQEREAGEIPSEAPKREDFPSKIAYVIAEAKWKIAHGNLSNSLDAATAKQATVTVKPSYVPNFDLFASREELVDDRNDAVLTAFAKATNYPNSANTSALIEPELDDEALF